MIDGDRKRSAAGVALAADADRQLVAMGSDLAAVEPNNCYCCCDVAAEFATSSAAADTSPACFHLQLLPAAVTSAVATVAGGAADVATVAGGAADVATVVGGAADVVAAVVDRAAVGDAAGGDDVDGNGDGDRHLRVEFGRSRPWAVADMAADVATVHSGNACSVDVRAENCIAAALAAHNFRRRNYSFRAIACDGAWLRVASFDDMSTDLVRATRRQGNLASSADAAAFECDADDVDDATKVLAADMVRA